MSPRGDLTNPVPRGCLPSCPQNHFLPFFMEKNLHKYYWNQRTGHKKGHLKTIYFKTGTLKSFSVKERFLRVTYCIGVYANIQPILLQKSFFFLFVDRSSWFLRIACLSEVIFTDFILYSSGQSVSGPIEMLSQTSRQGRLVSIGSTQSNRNSFLTRSAEHEIC